MPGTPVPSSSRRTGSHFTHLLQVSGEATRATQNPATRIPPADSVRFDGILFAQRFLIENYRLLRLPCVRENPCRQDSNPTSDSTSLPLAAARQEAVRPRRPAPRGF